MHLMNYFYTPDNKINTRRLLGVIVVLFSFAAICFLLFYQLDNWPSAWWDEGWYLDSARNWIQHGHIGHYLDGQPIPPRIPVRFPVLVPTTISMKLFGVGIWQARLPVAILTIMALALYGYISTILYNRKTAIVALLIVLILAPLDLNPLYLGRQIWAEMPMMFYLLAGYTLIWLAISRNPWWAVGASLSFGIAIHTKLQVPPFWIASIILAILVAAKLKQNTKIRILLSIAIGSVFVAIVSYGIQNVLMPGSFNDPGLTRLLFNTVIFVFTIPVRLQAFTYGVIYSLPQILGFIVAGQQVLRMIFTHRSTIATTPEQYDPDKEILRAAIWGLGASWCIWYLTMSLFWVRYLFPVFFIGTIFFAAYLGKLTEGYKIRPLIHKASSLLLGRAYNRINFESVLVLIALSLMLGATIKAISNFILYSNNNPKLAADYLEKNIPHGAKVETFGSELFILANDIDFHYPSDLVSMQLYRKFIADPLLPIDYDPLLDKPDYLVVDPFSSFWQLYDIVMPPERIDLEAEVGGYRIYRVIYP